MVGQSVHPSGSGRKWFEEIGGAAKAHSQLLRLANSAMTRNLGLARVSQAAAFTTREKGAGAVQLRDAATAARASEPSTATAEMALRPHDRHGLPERSSLFEQRHSGGADRNDIYAPQELPSARPGPCECLTRL